jgi:hypothetical protein
MEGIKFKHLRVTRLPSGFSFEWQQPGEIASPLATGIPDLKKGVELLLIDPRIPLLTKILMEFSRLAEENGWDYEALCEKFPSDAAGSPEGLT